MSRRVETFKQLIRAQDMVSIECPELTNVRPLRALDLELCRVRSTSLQLITPACTVLYGVALLSGRLCIDSDELYSIVPSLQSRNQYVFSVLLRKLTE
ncbi:hypothetical protein FB451DRAFT_1421621 [Mycena latifolia]|nr:hypothetical protein FB451DRAFT_1421621 [Mycena latifolia]